MQNQAHFINRGSTQFGQNNLCESRTGLNLTCGLCARTGALALFPFETASPRLVLHHDARIIAPFDTTTICFDHSRAGPLQPHARHGHHNLSPAISSRPQPSSWTTNQTGAGRHHNGGGYSAGHCRHRRRPYRDTDHHRQHDHTRRDRECANWVIECN